MCIYCEPIDSYDWTPPEIDLFDVWVIGEGKCRRTDAALPLLDAQEVLNGARPSWAFAFITPHFDAANAKAFASETKSQFVDHGSFDLPEYVNVMMAEASYVDE
jgi:hypothetical protein